MGNTYKNKGVVGAMGDNAVASDNVFLQDARRALSEVDVTAVDGALIAKLAEALAAQKTEHLQLKERMDGAKQLAAIAQAAESGDALEEPLVGWRKWLKGLGDRAQPVLSVLANVTTVGAPIAKLLGLPV